MMSIVSLNKSRTKNSSGFLHVSEIPACVKIYIMKQLAKPYANYATDVLENMLKEGQGRIAADNSKPRSPAFWKLVEIKTSLLCGNCEIDK